jgi:hypothetical protein
MKLNWNYCIILLFVKSLYGTVDGVNKVLKCLTKFIELQCAGTLVIVGLVGSRTNYLCAC